MINVQGYNVYVNGSPHCVLRYRQLNTFHDQLRKIFGQNSLPAFPPKRYLPMNERQLEERRSLLEKYIQLLSSQSEKVGTSEAFRRFFLAAQTDAKRPEPVILELFLTSTHSLRVDVKSTDGTHRVLEEAARVLNLPLTLLPYFSLYVAQKNDGQGSCSSSTSSNLSASLSTGSGSNSKQATPEFRLIRRLQSFESPFITMNTLTSLTDKKHFLTIRKSYWDTAYDEEVMTSDVGLDLLYMQTMTDVSQGWICLTKEAKHQLRLFQQDHRKRQYMDLARTLKYYSYIHFDNCVCDFPEIDSTVTVSLGGRELLIRPNDCSSGIRELSFKVTRIRCWRLITSLEGMISRSTTRESLQKLDLSFEYLMNKDSMRWITIESDQAVLISLSLQAIVDELLMKRRGLKYGSQRTVNAVPVPSDHRQEETCNSILPANSNNVQSSNGSQTAVKKSGINKPASGGVMEEGRCCTNRNMNGVRYVNVRSEVENDAFRGIGDEDL